MEVIKTLEGRVTDRIKKFEEALDELGQETMEQFNHRTQYDTVDEIAYKKLKIIIKVMNEGWEADPTSDKQLKWYPYWNLPIKSKNDIGGSGFSLYGCSRQLSLSHVGLRLCTKNEDLCRYIATNFIDIYRDMICK